VRPAAVTLALVRVSWLRVAVPTIGGVVALAGAVVAATPAATTSGALGIAANPGLYPRFQPAITDYVSRCGQTGRLELSIAAPSGETVSVDGGPPRSGSFTVTIALDRGQSVVLATKAGGHAARYHVRCLPKDFPKWTAQRTGSPQAQWYLVAPQGSTARTYVILFDGHGVPAYWIADDGALNASMLRGHRLAWFQYQHEHFGVSSKLGFEEHRLNGSLVRVHKTVGVPTDLHELQQLPNGNFLQEAYRQRSGVDMRRSGGPKDASVYDAEIQELTASGKLRWRWSSKGHIDPSESARWHWVQWHAPADPPSYDLVHVNSLQVVGRKLVLSGRHVDAVYQIDRSTGKVDWKLGGTRTARSLDVVGDPHSPDATFGGQHDARVLPDGTLTVFDNATYRDRPPRDLRFRIDAKARTATVIEQLTDPAVPESPAAGSTRKLAGGDWVTSWGATSLVTEMRPSGQRVFSLDLGGRTSYRAIPVPFGELSAATLRAAMDRRFPRRR
jgi:hypothetical protein